MNKKQTLSQQKNKPSYILLIVTTIIATAMLAMSLTGIVKVNPCDQLGESWKQKEKDCIRQTEKLLVTTKELLPGDMTSAEEMIKEFLEFYYNESAKQTQEHDGFMIEKQSEFKNCLAEKRRIGIKKLDIRNTKRKTYSLILEPDNYSVELIELGMQYPIVNRGISNDTIIVGAIISEEKIIPLVSKQDRCYLLLGEEAGVIPR